MPMCLFPCYMVRSLSSHAYMLGFMFFHVYMLSSYVYMHVSMPMPISMLPHACVFGSMLSTCFMLFSMCLCALCHVHEPRPRLCLSCHVLL